MSYIRHLFACILLDIRVHLILACDGIYQIGCCGTRLWLWACVVVLWYQQMQNYYSVHELRFNVLSEFFSSQYKKANQKPSNNFFKCNQTQKTNKLDYSYFRKSKKWLIMLLLGCWSCYITCRRRLVQLFRPIYYIV